MRRSLLLRRRYAPRGALIAGIVATVCCLVPAASAALTQARTVGEAAGTTGPVSPVPASGTPQLAKTSNTEQIRQLVQCGGTMYAVGSFTGIKRFAGSYARNNIFSFKATKPFTVTSWNPDVNGVVNSIALSRGCGNAYIGGTFTTVGGVAAHNIAKISTSTGALVTGFGHDANKQVNTLVETPNGHLLVGGQFTQINGSKAHAYYASLSPTTGKDDGYLNLSVSGHYIYRGVKPNTTEIYNQQLSPNGSDVLAEGVFTSVGGQPRQQIFMMQLDAASGSVTGWDPTDFTSPCVDRHPLYVKTAAWSPDSSTVYVATTGFHPRFWNNKFPLPGLCDVAVAFAATQQNVNPLWTNYTGCYTLLSVAADSSAVYIGGHEQYADNQNACKSAGPGSYPAPGLGGLTPDKGALLLNSAGNAGLYSRSRGLGADDMLVTNAGLWIASDNLDGSAMCGGVFGHAGICFLPYG